ncbi:adenylate kinase 7-like [Myxocyprinus asiaticus]|uniref:adenylate kinase 7-like n=1 Tax=Myxocyprinus asiaticus TaxID=70543 RepID=UPI00222168E1|nr:adenylate kinase 7-like [Myxocyprinus asiaticus]
MTKISSQNLFSLLMPLIQKNRVMKLLENLVEGTSYTPQQFLQCLAGFMERNVEDESVLNYFEDLEIHPEHIGSCISP